MVVLNRKTKQQKRYKMLDIKLKEKISFGNKNVDQIKTELESMIPEITCGRKKAVSLAREIVNGEAGLFLTTEGNIIRLISIVEVKVFSSDNPYRVLIEKGQYFYNSNKLIQRKSPDGKPLFISEKKFDHESPICACFRALNEELKIIPLGVHSVIHDLPIVENKDSSYSGLRSFVKIYSAIADIKPEDVKDEYVERSEIKDTYFGWAEYNHLKGGLF